MLQQPAQSTTLLERIGGRPMLTVIVRTWFQRIFTVDELRQFFRTVDLKKVTSHQWELLYVRVVDEPPSGRRIRFHDLDSNQTRAPLSVGTERTSLR